jgi:TPR repeat protein
MRARAALLIVLLQSAAALAQTPLKVASPPAVLNDPKVAACRLVAAPRTDPKVPDGATAVEVAGAMFKIGPVIEAMSLCREALAQYPTEPSVITAEYTASETLKTLLFGFKRLDSDVDLFKFALANEAESTKMEMLRPMYYFYLGSGYEYGIGAPVDFGQAMKYYLKAAEGSASGADVAKQKVASLLQKAQATVQK